MSSRAVIYLAMLALLVCGAIAVYALRPQEKLASINDGVVDDFFAFRIFLPDASTEHFWIAHDLAELFDTDTQNEAVALLDEAIDKTDPSLASDLDIDRESGMAFIHAVKPDAMVQVALIIDRLAVPAARRNASTTQADHLLELLQSWKRPKSYEWQVGSVFAIPLSDGTFAHGQVLTKYTTCALFDARTDTPRSDVDTIVQATVISVIHLGSDLLDDGTWRVVGKTKPKTDPASSPYGAPSTVGTVSFGGGYKMADFAEAYYGLRPWAAGFDKGLMLGLKRPSSAVMPTPEEQDSKGTR